MRDTLKQALLIIIIPTILWGLLAYWHYLYSIGMVSGLMGYKTADVVFPVFLPYLFLLIGYVFSMIIIYLLIYKKEVENQYWGN